MTGFVIGADRSQETLFPTRLEDNVAEDNPVRVIDLFVDQLDLGQLGFSGINPKMTGRPAYHPATMLKIYIYGYLNRVQSSRRLERECQRNIEMMWLTGRLAPDFKTIADFREDNGPATVFVGLRARPVCITCGESAPRDLPASYPSATI
jgi:transposase